MGEPPRCSPTRHGSATRVGARALLSRGQPRREVSIHDGFSAVLGSVPNRLAAERTQMLGKWRHRGVGGVHPRTVPNVFLELRDHHQNLVIVRLGTRSRGTRAADDSRHARRFRSRGTGSADDPCRSRGLAAARSRRIDRPDDPRRNGRNTRVVRFLFGEVGSSRRRLLLLRPGISVPRFGNVSLPTRQAAEIERELTAVAGRDATSPILLLEEDWLAAGRAPFEAIFLRHRARLAC